MAEGRPPLLFVLSGPSGAGKDSLMQELRRRVDDVHYATTATTRARRPGEIEGESYFFLSQVTYDAELDKGELLAPAEVHGNWYGAPMGPLRQAFAAGRDIMLKIDVQGAIQVRRRFPQAIFIFLAPPSIEHLIARLRSRHTESPEELERRFRDARFEMEQMPWYDYIVVNRDDGLRHAVSDVACIITAERLRTHHQRINLDAR